MLEHVPEALELLHELFPVRAKLVADLKEQNKHERAQMEKRIACSLTSGGV
jgi:hypothetical protein